MKINNKEVKIENFDIFTYRRIRRAIGYLGISLPILLVGLSYISFFKTPLQPSISNYYYTNFREIFTGTLAAVGLFLIRYKGHGNPSIWKNDNLLTNIAGIMAIGVALFPMNPEDSFNKTYTLIPYAEKWLGWLHYSFAALLFLIMALLAINVFTIGQENETQDSKSMLNENNIYRFCGYSIIVFVILVPISETFKWFHYSTLILEALALFAFGSAWLIKGRALGDSGEIGKKLYQENNPVDTEKVFEE
ncbi:hypothetical protein SAMN05444397_104189 [Flavobacterium aquidurense]|uniref:DUF998 domain-containing protein n=1 Tax=Flavobacterium frigidimaris TaxID=262320 RepID=A0ABX4BRA4_FLAFR|nr:hypothetical protein [Flavobacterium frigidimaris]OXA79542.1 hypothetical protein B0A65_09215 [Flavobacterium frigidimaris]SDZ21445.1 hypothetical protein SAMN05444397_104189 [Flavobacterium aquidurense]